MKDKTVSVAKGVAIILMVLGHTGFNDFWGGYIYLFHMPLFFFLSGYCFKEVHLTDFKTFAKKRIKGAYWPYVKWSLLFLLCHNLFFALHIYGEEFGDTIYGINDFIKNALFIAFSMTHAEKLLGGYWFLHSYFISSFIFFFIVFLSKSRLKLLFLGIALLLIVSIFFLFTRFYIPGYLGSTELMATSFMLAGFIYKKSNLQLEKKPFVAILVGFFVVLIGAIYCPSSMLTLSYPLVAPYFFFAIVGTLLVLSICKCVLNLEKVASFFSYLGDKSIVILTWHFLCFKLVTYMIIVTTGQPLSQLATFPIMGSFSKNGWWLLYTLAGVMIPIALERLLSMFFSKIKNSRSLVSGNTPFKQDDK